MRCRQGNLKRPVQLSAAAAILLTVAACGGPTATPAPPTVDSAAATSSAATSVVAGREPVDVQILPSPTPDPAFPTTYHSLAIDPGNPDNLWLTFGPIMLHSSDGGASWAPSEAASPESAVLYHVIFPAPDALYQGGHKLLRKSADGGATWSGVPEIGDARIKGLTAAPGNPQRLLALVDDRGLLQSVDGGQSWSLLTAAAPEVAFGVWAVNAEPLQLLTVDRANQSVHHSADGGESWSALEQSGLTGELFGAALASDGTAFAATSEGLFASADGGLTWSERGDRGRLVSVAVSPVDPSVVLIVDGRGQVYRSEDGGNTW